MVVRVDLISRSMVSRQRRTRRPKSRSARTGRVSSAPMLQRERSVSACSRIPREQGPQVSTTNMRRSTSMMWVPRSWALACSDSTTFPTIRTGVAGGATSRRSGFRSSSSPTSRGPPSRWPVALRSISSTPLLLMRSSRLLVRRTAKMCGLAVVLPSFATILKAGLVDRLHVAIAPILLGRGIRLWDDLRGLEAGYTVKAETAPSGTIHLTFQR